MPEDNRFRFYTAPFALLRGWKLLSGSPILRKLAIRPLLVGIITYGILLLFAYPAAESLSGSVAIQGNEILATIVHWIMMIVSVIVVLIAITLLSLLSMIIFAGYYQSELSRETLVLLNYPVPPATDSVGATSREVIRVTIGEIGKAIFLVPAYLFLFIGSLFPPFAPFAFIIGSWLFAFQWFDYALDSCRKGLFRRLTYGLAHPLLYLFLARRCWLSQQFRLRGFFLHPCLS